jgi:hypothetical protein
MLIYVGDWREESGNPDAPSIREAVRDQPHPDEPRILSYIRAGYRTIAGAGCFHMTDPVNPELVAPFASTLHTDGTYVWPGNLGYFVEKYHVELPAEFIAHMRANNWVAPAIPEADLDEFYNGVDNRDRAPYPELENPTVPTEPLSPPPRPPWWKFW